MANTSSNTISLKALVNNVMNKIIYIEADNDFVDVLFSFLTIPVGTIIMLSNRHSFPLGIGCLKKLYESVESSDSQLFQSEECRAMFLCLRNGAESLLKNLKLKIDSHETNVSVSDGQDGGSFVKGLATFIVSDDLKVLPPLTTASYSLITKLGFNGWNTIEELTFNVGTEQVLNLLLCSLVSKTPLTDILLKHKPLSDFRPEIGKYMEHGNAGRTVNDDLNICINLVVSKSKNIVCYAEAGEDFVTLLSSFLHFPLGFILKELPSSFYKGCVNHVYKSAQDLDDWYFKSNYHRETLMNPKLFPEFGYEQKRPCTLATDRTHVLANRLWNSVKITDSKSHNNDDRRTCGFLEEPAMFLITDSLIVSPISPILSMSKLCELCVPITDIEVKVTKVRRDEALSLFMASFVCQSALTSSFQSQRPFARLRIRCLDFLI
ncbi:hypothetical protein PS1_029555 [Malus domestica]